MKPCLQENTWEPAMNISKDLLKSFEEQLKASKPGQSTSQEGLEESNQLLFELEQQENASTSTMTTTIELAESCTGSSTESNHSPKRHQDFEDDDSPPKLVDMTNGITEMTNGVTEEKCVSLCSTDTEELTSTENGENGSIKSNSELCHRTDDIILVNVQPNEQLSLKISSLIESVYKDEIDKDGNKIEDDNKIKDDTLVKDDNESSTESSDNDAPEEVEEIMGVTRYKDGLKFLIKYKNSPEPQTIASTLANEQHTQEVISYYESISKFDRNVPEKIT